MTPVLTMETVVAVAIAVLAAIFVASLVALIAVCSHRHCRNKDLISRQMRDTSTSNLSGQASTCSAQRLIPPDAALVEHMEPVEGQTSTSELELDDVGINTNLEEILEDETWVNDATGVAPHCLAILKTCHHLTEKLVGMTMSGSQQLRNPEVLTDIVAIAKRIGPRVDEVMRAMYPPLDPRLLEARCTALVLSVSHLVLITKNACRLSGVMDWIDQSLADVEDHLKILREASRAYDSTPSRPQSVVIGEAFAIPPLPQQPVDLVNETAHQQMASQSQQQSNQVATLSSESSQV